MAKIQTTNEQRREALRKANAGIDAAMRYLQLAEWGTEEEARRILEEQERTKPPPGPLLDSGAYAQGWEGLEERKLDH